MSDRSTSSCDRSSRQLRVSDGPPRVGIRSPESGVRDPESGVRDLGSIPSANRESRSYVHPARWGVIVIEYLNVSVSDWFCSTILVREPWGWSELPKRSTPVVRGGVVAS
jgi:hypothetical protein